MTSTSRKAKLEESVVHVCIPFQTSAQRRDNVHIKLAVLVTVAAATAVGAIVVLVALNCIMLNCTTAPPP